MKYQTSSDKWVHVHGTFTHTGLHIETDCTIRTDVFTQIYTKIIHKIHDILHIYNSHILNLSQTETTTIHSILKHYTFHR